MKPWHVIVILLLVIWLGLSVFEPQWIIAFTNFLSALARKAINTPAIGH